jgi:hypothetical protein
LISSLSIWDRNKQYGVVKQFNATTNVYVNSLENADFKIIMSK